MISPNPAHNAAIQIERIGRLLRAGANSCGLNPAQWDALRYLSRANRFSRNPSAAAAWLATTKGTVSQTLLALERAGLIARRSDANDRRGTQIEVTAAGKDLLERADPMSALMGPLGDLPPLHASLMSQALSRVLQFMLAESGRQAFGSCATCVHFTSGHPGALTPATGQCGLLKAAIAAEALSEICVHYEAA